MKKLTAAIICFALCLPAVDALALNRTERSEVAVLACMAYGAGFTGYCWAPGADGETYSGDAFPTASRTLAREIVAGIEGATRDRRQQAAAVEIACEKIKGGIVGGSYDPGVMESADAATLAVFRELGEFAANHVSRLAGGQ